jgi:hypothetical protein
MKSKPGTVVHVSCHRSCSCCADGGSLPIHYVPCRMGWVCLADLADTSPPTGSHLDSHSAEEPKDRATYIFKAALRA